MSQPGISQVQTISQIPFSTDYSSKYLLTNFFNIIEIENDDGTVDEYFDALEHDIFSFIDKVTSWQPYRWDGSRPITTVAYQYYNNTTVWWIILIYNGYCHPLEIVPGTLLKIPDITQLNLLLSNHLQQTGKVITI